MTQARNNNFQQNSTTIPSFDVLLNKVAQGQASTVFPQDPSLSLKDPVIELLNEHSNNLGLSKDNTNLSSNLSQSKNGGKSSSNHEKVINEDVILQEQVESLLNNSTINQNKTCPYTGKSKLILA